jgi:LysM repeat protein
MDRDYSSSSTNSNRAYEAEGSIYTVRAGDTMWDIAKAFGTSVEALRRINYIERGSRIYVGQKMKIPSDASMLAQKNSSRSKRTLAAGNSNSGNSNSGGSSSAPVISSSSSTYKVKAGDTLWDIARMFGTTTTQIRQLNSLGRSSRIFPGQVLTVSGNSADYVIYKVRRGDTLSKIAQRHRTTITRILALNGLTDPDNIGVGDQLKIQSR